MKHLFFVIAIFVIALCISCNNSSASKATTEDEAATKNATSSSSTGDAVFSYNLDGAKVSGGEVDATQTNNIADITQTNNGNKLTFFLGDFYQANTETFSHSLRFAIPDKTGAVTLTPNEDNWNIQLFLGNDKNDKYVLYANETFNITLTNISSTRVSGTFSGKVKLAEGQGSGKAELTITDGKFDIPVSHVKG